MKITLLFAITAILVVAAGCTTTSPGTPAPVTVPAATQQPTFSIPADALPMNASVTLGNATHNVTVSVDSFEITAGTEPGTYTVTDYVAARNTGLDPIRFVWFSKLTDLTGTSVGGIGVSHGGNGARSNPIGPNSTEAARDWNIVGSNQSLARLSNGAVLDVYFFEQKVNTTHSVMPDYHVTWIIDYGAIK